MLLATLYSHAPVRCPSRKDAEQQTDSGIVDRNGGINADVTEI